MAKAKKKRVKGEVYDPMGHTVPDWPTAKKLLLPRGIVVPVRGALWMYKRVPLAPVRDARTDEEALNVGIPLSSAFQELAASTTTTLKVRSAARSSYREVHLLLVNLTRRYAPHQGARHAEQLRTWYGDRLTQQRLLLFGVKLRDEVGGVDRTFKDVVESAAMSLATAEVPLSDYEGDIREVDDALTRCGFETPDVKDFELAESWWVAGGTPESPVVNHANHIHVFRSVAGAQMAAQAGAGDCRQWPADVPGHHTIAMGSVHNFDFQFESNRNSRTQWASSLLDLGADAISIRGKIEPSYITRSELRRQRKRYIEDINQRNSQGRMSDQEQSEMLGTLESVEGAYSSGKASPTLVETSVLAAFSGRGSENLETIANGRPFKVSPMSYRQNYALPETWIGSPVRSNPNVMDLPTTTIAFSGLPNLSTVGDRSGAQIGFTLHDKQSALFSATASADEDSTPLAIVCGSAGSGKDLVLSTRIPTPTGWTTMGALTCGDEVLGRDGKPVRVSWKSPTLEKDDVYRITLSDGQTFDAGEGHQWVVSSYADRNAHKTGKRKAALRAHDRAHEIARELEDLALRSDAQDLATTDELIEMVRSAIPDAPYTHRQEMVASLRMMDIEPLVEERTVVRKNKRATMTKTDPAVVFPVRESLGAALRAWEGTSAGNKARWGERMEAHARAATAVLERTDLPELLTEREIIDLLSDEGDPFRIAKGSLAKTVRSQGVESGTGTIEVTIPTTRTSTQKIHRWPVRESLGALSARIRQQYAVRPRSEVGEHRMTTGEMLAQGLAVPNGALNFAIRATEPLDLPERDLPVAPYTLGAWLGDGTTGSPSIASMDEEIIESIRDDGLVPTRVEDIPGKANLYHYGQNLTPGLRAAGFAVKAGSRDKHIPAEYLRASFDQRLALLQGLMDTDGTISRSGAAELCLTNKRLIDDALELIRSLGIKASLKEGVAAYTKADPETGEKKRTVTGTRYRVKFTTTLPVFRLARKRALLPTEVRETQQWLYIESIEKLPMTRTACITVDSEDRTYLVGGMVPTSNTQLMAYAGYQFALEDRPVIIVDPKKGSDLSPAFKGHVTTFSLDSFADAQGGEGGTGIFDPLRFSKTPQDGINTAVSMLHFADIWQKGGTQNFEADLKVALKYGISKGARAIGTALMIAQQDGVATPELAEPIIRQSRTDPLFGACVGLSDEGQVLSASQGITYIKVGNADLELPAMGANQRDLSLTARISVSLIRMMVFGSAEALRGRRGVMMLDEAWVFLGAGAEEVERLGRLARSLEVLPVLFTQRVTDIIEAKLQNHISRGVILHLRDPQEARAAFEIFGVDPTEKRMSMTTNTERQGETGIQYNTRKPIFEIMKDGSRGRLLRGSVGLYCDLRSRAVDTEIAIPQGFLELSSTNALDRARREGREVY